MKWFEHAAIEARKSICLHGKCGAVLVQQGIVIAAGYNRPSGNNSINSKCHIDFPREDRRKPKSDCTCCDHAEWVAIMAVLNIWKLAGSIMYFTRVDSDGVIQPSGVPYCTVCSRLALSAGISYWALWQASGPRLFGAQEYNDLSYEFHLIGK